MATVYKVRFAEGTNSDEVKKQLELAYTEILALTTPVILYEQFQLSTTGATNNKWYSVLIKYSYDATAT
jgi:hypothetical protein